MALSAAFVAHKPLGAAVHGSVNRRCLSALSRCFSSSCSSRGNNDILAATLQPLESERREAAAAAAASHPAAAAHTAAAATLTAAAVHTTEAAAPFPAAAAAAPCSAAARGLRTTAAAAQKSLPGHTTAAVSAAAAQSECGRRDDGEKEAIAYLSLGSNFPLGRRLANIEWALQQLQQRRVGKIISTSCLYESVPAFHKRTVPAITADASHPLYLNAAVKIRTHITNPLQLLRQLKQLEADCGRFCPQNRPAAFLSKSPPSRLHSSSSLCSSPHTAAVSSSSPAALAAAASPSPGSASSPASGEGAAVTTCAETTAPAQAASAAAAAEAAAAAAEAAAAAAEEAAAAGSHAAVAGGTTGEKQQSCLFGDRREAKQQQEQREKHRQLHQHQQQEGLSRGGCEDRHLQQRSSSSSSNTSSSSCSVDARSLDVDLLFVDAPAPIIIDTEADSSRTRGHWGPKKQQQRETALPEANLSLHQKTLQVHAAQGTASTSARIACEGTALPSATPPRAGDAAGEAAPAAVAAAFGEAGRSSNGVVEEGEDKRKGSEGAVADVREEAATEEGQLHVVLPHPLISERNFILFPLCDIDPTYVHPVAGVSVKTLLKRNLERRRKRLEELRLGEQQPLQEKGGEAQELQDTGATAAAAEAQQQQRPQEGGGDDQQQWRCLTEVRDPLQGKEGVRGAAGENPYGAEEQQQQQELQPQHRKKKGDFYTLDGRLAIPRRCFAFGEEIIWTTGGVAGVADTMRYISEALDQLQSDSRADLIPSPHVPQQQQLQQQQEEEKASFLPHSPPKRPFPSSPSPLPPSASSLHPLRFFRDGRTAPPLGDGRAAAARAAAAAGKKELQALLDRLKAEPRLRLMGVVNVSPESFSDKHTAGAEAAAAAARLLQEGADIVDVGGEASNPFVLPHQRLSEVEELQRVLPTIERIRSSSQISAIAAATGRPVVLSIDTIKKGVAEACLRAGALCVNDETGEDRPPAGSDPLEAATQHSPQPAAVVLMHKRGTNTTYDEYLDYDDVVTHVGTWLAEKAKQLQQQGLPRWRIMVDVGLGFAKTAPQHYELLRGLLAVQQLLPAGIPQLIGHSHKRFIGYAIQEGNALAQQQQQERLQAPQQQEGEKQQKQQLQPPLQSLGKQRPTAAMIEERRWGGGAVVTWCTMHAGGSVLAIRTHDVKESRWTRDVTEKILCGGRNRWDAFSPLDPDMKSYYVDWQ